MSRPKEFGIALKAIRVAANEPEDVVADAVEISLDELRAIEEGKRLPDQDILEMFISHFSLRESEALRLLELAGFSFEEETSMSFTDDSPSEKPKELNVNMPKDMQILYTDMVHVAGNKYGIVVNFIQGIGPSGKPTVVSRVGMSREHAKSLLDVLKTSLEQSDKKESDKP